MARYNEILTGRFNRAMQKMLSMKGPAALVSLSDQVVPSFVLFYGVENRYLEAWDRFGTADLQSASVGNVNGVRLRNPSGSNVVIVIEKILLSNDSAVVDGFNVSFGPTGADLASILSLATTRLDPRGRPNPTLSSSFTQAAAVANLGNLLYAVNLLAQTSFDLIVEENHQITLLPGDAMQFVSNAANATTSISYLWRERFLEDSERT